MTPTQDAHAAQMTRRPAVAGSFYPADPAAIAGLVERLLADSEDGRGPAPEAPSTDVVGLLVPHAGLEWSGLVAATAWRRLRAHGARAASPAASPTVVILGTNHSALLRGVGVWDAGDWEIPGDAVEVDGVVAAAIAGLGPPFAADRGAHLREHSIEVQLPLLRAVDPWARIVPLAVSAGTGPDAIAAGARLGRLLAVLRAAGTPLVLAISTDMAHYPRHGDSVRATEALLPAILELDAAGTADREHAITGSGVRGLVCGMCGIEPTVLGLSALDAMGARPGVRLAAATSADAGAPPDRTVGYLAMAWPSAR
jgi:hypothetical protein